MVRCSRLQWVFLAFCLQVSLVQSYKILVAYPSFSKSHLVIVNALTKGLAEDGHNVTVISSFPQKVKIPNHRDIYLEIPQHFGSK